MPKVMLRKTWDAAQFKRNVRNEKNEIVRTLTFEPGVVVQVSKEDLPFIADDIGKALLPMQEVDGKYVVIDVGLVDVASTAVKPAEEQQAEEQPASEETNEQDTPAPKAKNGKSGKSA